MIVKILEFDKIYVHIHISMSVTWSNYTVGAMYQRQIKQYLTFCLGKKKHHCVETCKPVTGALTLKECERKYP